MSSLGFLPNTTGFVPPNTVSGTPEDWSVNSSAQVAAAGETATFYYYADPDGVVRPADGVYGNAFPAATATGDGMMLFGTSATPSGGPTANYAVGDKAGNVQHGRRPVILNRPFRSVGELGYVFRDLPFKTLDFFSPSSADGGLLDVFSITDEPKVVAGRVNVSNASYPVLQALLSLASKKDLDPNYYMSASGGSPYGSLEATFLAKAIATQLSPATSGGGPLLNRANLASLGPIIHAPPQSSVCQQPRCGQ